MYRSLKASTIFFLCLLSAFGSYGQAPVISYTTPDVYTINNAITPLKPVNTGGAVPATIYSQVSTFAGSGQPGSANGNKATASFRYAGAMAFDAAGNLFVLDAGSFYIKKIATDGIVSTFAGSGATGNVDAAGNVTGFVSPTDIAIDKNNNVYLLDQVGVIRKITPSGNISTLAGSAIQGYTDGVGAAAKFNGPYAISAGNDNSIYVSEWNNNVIRKITPAGVVSTLAGNGNVGLVNGTGSAARFHFCFDMVIDHLGNLFVLDVNNKSIRKVTPAGVVTTVSGPSVDGQHWTVGTIGVDYAGNLYVSKENTIQIFKITPNGVTSVLAGQVGAGNKDDIGTAALFAGLGGFAVDGEGNLYVGDVGNNDIRKIILTGYTIDKPLPAGLSFDPTTGIISGKPTEASPLKSYTVTAYNKRGSSSYTVNIKITNVIPPPIVPAPNITYHTPNVYSANKAIDPLKPNNTGGIVPATIYGQVSTFAGSGQHGASNKVGTAATFNNITRLGQDASGNLYVADRDNNLIRKITPTGSVSTFASGFNQPNGVAVDDFGNVYVADAANNQIKKIKPNGVVSVFAGNGNRASVNGDGANASFAYPYSVAIDATDNIYVADSQNNLIRKIAPSRKVTTLAGSGNPAFADGTGTAASFYNPSAVTVDVLGNIYAADPYNNRIRKITSTGVATTVAGSSNSGARNGPVGIATFNVPAGVAIDAVNNIYVADGNNNMIRKIDYSGMVTTLAGNGTLGSADGVGDKASFNFPNDVQVNPNGFVYVTDYGNNIIRKVITTGYTIDKTLPAGLTFDATTGFITGAATVTSPVTNYTVTAYNAGGSSSYTFSIKITAAVTVPITFNPLAQKTPCNADFDPGATSDLAITYTSSNNAVATIVNNKVHLVGIGTTTITADNGSTMASQILTVVAPPTPLVTIDLAGGVSACVGLNITIVATAINAGANPTYIWMVNGNIIAGQTGAIFNSTALVNGDKVTVKVVNNDCGITSAESAAADIITPPLQVSTVTIATSVALPVCQGSVITFIPTPNNYPTIAGLPSYVWYVNNIEIASGDNFSSNTLAAGDKIYCIMTVYGTCVSPPVLSNVITITGFLPESVCSFQKMIIPNTFTPNGDGYNDTWQINALGNYPNVSVSIFNRYGTRVFFAGNGYSKPWDATFNGNAVPSGTYYYIIDPKDGTAKLSGYVVVLK